MLSSSDRPTSTRSPSSPSSPVPRSAGGKRGGWGGTPGARGRTGVAAGGVGGTEAAVGVGRAVGLALDERLAVVLELDVALGGVEGEEVVDHHARHARAHLVRAERLEPVRGAGGAVIETPVLERGGDCHPTPPRHTRVAQHGTRGRAGTRGAAVATRGGAYPCRPWSTPRSGPREAPQTRRAS